MFNQIKMAAEEENLDLEEETPVENKGKKVAKHDSGAADLEKVTDYVEEAEISSQDISNVRRLQIFFYYRPLTTHDITGICIVWFSYSFSISLWKDLWQKQVGNLLIYPINCVAGKSGILSHHLFAHLSTIVIRT